MAAAHQQKDKNHREPTLRHRRDSTPRGRKTCGSEVVDGSLAGLEMTSALLLIS
jgi:hypothetical protein